MKRALVAVVVTIVAFASTFLAGAASATSRDVAPEQKLVTKPRPACSPETVKTCVRLEGFRSSVGIGWKREGAKGGEIFIACSAQMLDQTTLITADHCFDARDAKEQDVLVLRHFDGGSFQARRPKEHDVVTNLSVSVGRFHRPEAGVTGPEIRDHDVALVELVSPLPNSAWTAEIFPRLARPPNFENLETTIAAWGGNGGREDDGIGLAVARAYRTAAKLYGTHRTVRRWQQTGNTGGGLCNGDSGGPLFAGQSISAVNREAELIGIVAGGAASCSGGDQLFTDLTDPSVQTTLCTIARRARLIDRICPPLRSGS